MMGITDDHEFKTRDGWKYFDDIDIQKDELYCWAYEGDVGDPRDVWYCNSYEQNGKQITDCANFYINPEKKIFNSNNDYELFQIKNDYIDTIVTSNYSMPIIMEDYENRYNNWIDLVSITDLYKSVYESQKKTDTQKNDECGYYGITETLISPSYTWYDLINLMYKIELNHIKRLPTINKKIVCFIMPKRIGEEASWRVYVRRNGKEFWL